jgi:hypothetical protein
LLVQLQSWAPSETDALASVFFIADPLNPMHPSGLPEEELLRQCQVRHDRRSGPGGQHRNKVETAVIITHLPSGISAEANERRRQSDNRRVAIQRLRVALAIDFRTETDSLLDSTKMVAPLASATWRERTKNGRISVATDHPDFPTLLAEVLDMLAATQYDLHPAGALLEVTPSQIVKLLKQHPPALAKVNVSREHLGLCKLT